MELTLNTHMCLQGCDISKYQGKVDFFKMKKSGIRFVILRAGYGTTVDSKFKSYVDGAVKAGIAIGVYWFIYATDTKSAIANANKCLTVIEPYKDYISLGVWADWEYDSEKKMNGLSTSYRTTLVKNFLETVTSKGYFAGIYSNQDYVKYSKFSRELISAYPLWYAFYNEKTYSSYGNLGKGRHPYIWQYTSKGDGAKYGVSSSYIDLDRGYFDIPGTQPMNKPSIVVDEILPIIKGEPQQFKNIICNLKKALNADFRLNLYTDDFNVDQTLLTHLSNVNIGISNGQFVPDVVYVLQQLLAWWGYQISVDGIFGTGTENIVGLFQSQVGIEITKTTTIDFWKKILGQ